VTEGVPATSAGAPTIELEKVRLRALRPADTPALLGYLSNPVVTERTSFPEISQAMVAGMIERARSRWAAGEPSRWAVALRDDDQLIGTCGFNDWSPAHRWAELAFDLAPAWWGHGLMGQSVIAALAWIFRQNMADRVQAFVRVDNVTSQALLGRAGFEREGCLRSYRICRGQRYDFHVYALLRPDWLAARTALR
jgi:RimJ/RimL family protein N-acetyltransferase